ncbi:MAG: preprotein translocase subunit SecG [Candidatus Cryptobacteroides sp.]|nr:preprotein translocase subunit SecG [Bacteroidales bacterium]
MNVVFIILSVLIVLAAILLIAVVLLQNSKGDGMASNFVAGNQTFGVRQTADILEKITWGLVAFILVISVVSSFTMGSRKGQIDVTDKIETVAPDAQPEFPAAPIQQEAPTSENN